MTSPDISRPAPDDFELALFGPGLGEAMTVHLGHNKWIVIDSCREPVTRQPAALHYLGQMGVEVARDVRMVVATHWHDDHTQGISEVIRACSNASVVMSAAVRHHELLTMARAINASYGSLYSGLDELAAVMQYLNARVKEGMPMQKCARAAADTILLEDADGGGGQSVRVMALSPSATAIERAQLRSLASALGNGPYRIRVREVSPNDASVVLWLQAGEAHVLLGSDLEAGRDPKAGWLAVLDGRAIHLERAGAYKVAHHGALSGHETRVWDEMLESNPIALVSPFRNGNQILPTADDLKRLSGYTSRGFVTSRRVRRERWQNHVVREKVRSATRTMTNLAGDWGWIRARKSLMDTSSWRVDLFGSAQSIV